MVKLFRIATVKVTGKKYLVNYLDFRTNKAICWGEVTKIEGLKTWHDKPEKFSLNEVELGPEQVKTSAFLSQLFQQTVDGLKEKGAKVVSDRTSKG